MKALARALALGALLSLASPALAQEGEGEAGTAADDRASSFVAVDGARTEDVPGGALLVGAYGAALFLLVGYVVWLGVLSSGTNRELGRLAGILEEKEKRAEKKAAPAKAGADA